MTYEDFVKERKRFELKIIQKQKDIEKINEQHKQALKELNNLRNEKIDFLKTNDHFITEEYENKKKLKEDKTNIHSKNLMEKLAVGDRVLVKTNHGQKVKEVIQITENNVACRSTEYIEFVKDKKNKWRVTMNPRKMSPPYERGVYEYVHTSVVAKIYTTPHAVIIERFS